MKKGIFLLFTLIACAFVLASCTQSTGYMRKLQQVDSLMENNPQAAYDSLCLYGKGMERGKSQKISMRYRLLMAKVENKLYLDMPSDSAFQEVVDYYESKGTSNDKMTAHYLMGCIYRDQQEAPKAINSYREALEFADTLSHECDYLVLLSIYGQMADVFRMQYLHQEAIKAFQKYSYYSFRANKTDEYIRGIAFMAAEYYEQGDTLKAIRYTEKAHQLYLQHGMRKEAFEIYPKLYFACLYRSQYQKAHSYMLQYEKESGLFDKHNNIAEGREHYYKAKGMYYLGINQLDSALYYYRKLGNYGYRYETAQGLLEIYGKLGNNDSIQKYSKLCEHEMDRILNSTQAEATIQALSLYNYSNLQKEINEEKIRKERNKYVLTIIGIAIFLFLFYLVYRHKQIYKRMSDRLAEVGESYLQTFKKMEDAQDELNTLLKDKNLLIEKKQEQISSLTEELQGYKEEISKMNKSERKMILMTSNIVESFNEMTSMKRNSKKPGNKDWKELYAILQQSQPQVYERISSCKLSSQELQVCVLTYLGMDNTKISILVDTTAKTVCNAKQKANSKLFNCNTATSLYENLLSI